MQARTEPIDEDGRVELESPFVVEDRRSLELLQRAIMEARFFSGEPGSVLPGSPLLADLHERVVDKLVEQATTSEDHRAADRLQQWLEWENHTRERESLVSILREMEPAWSTWTLEGRCEVARSLMKPFSFSDKEVLEVVRSVSET